MNYDRELAFAKELALEAGQIMNRYFRADDIATEWKSDDTPVTAADLAINEMVIEKVKAAYPEHGVLGEENSFEPERDFIWVVDPVDGTVPFSMGIPVSTFLLTLVDRNDGQPVLSIIYDPYLKELYEAVKGGGAFLNDQPIQTSKAEMLNKSYIAVYGPPVQDERLNYKPGRILDSLNDQGANILKLASGAYTGAKIASGQFMAIMMRNGQPWDSAAIALLVEEAGGVATDILGNKRRFDRREYGCLISANPAIHEQLLKIIKGN